MDAPPAPLPPVSPHHWDDFPTYQLLFLNFYPVQCTLYRTVYRTVCHSACPTFLLSYLSPFLPFLPFAAAVSCQLLKKAGRGSTSPLAELVAELVAQLVAELVTELVVELVAELVVELVAPQGRPSVSYVGLN